MAGGVAGLIALFLLGRDVFMALVSSFFPLTLLILSVLGAIFFGIATPTEAAAVGSLGSLLLAGGLSLAVLRKGQGKRVLTCAHFGHGVLAVRRLVHLLVDLRLSRRSRADQGLHELDESVADDVPHHDAADHLRAGLAAGMD